MIFNNFLSKKLNLQSIIFFFILIIILFVIFNLFKIDEKTFIKNLIEKNTNIKIINNNETPSNEYDIIIYNNDFYNKLMRNGELGLGESYMDGDWESNNLQATLSQLIKNENLLENELIKNSLNASILKVKNILISIFPNNTLSSSKSNISFHYDIGNDLYEKMLDKNMQYTCAYFNKPHLNLDEAQEEKLNLIAKKMNFQPEDHVLDMGCGFGSAATYFAKKYNIKVLGVTLSKEQINYHKQHFAHPNVEIRYQDYREVTGKFDKIYSIGILEHVGRKNYKEYYDKCYELLDDNGIMLVHTIGTVDRYNKLSKWINKYIFPEAELPHISNLTQKFADKWYLQDYQNFGLSYSKTLIAWFNNIGNWEGLDNYDMRFRKMWKFYLLSCAESFKHRNINLNQLVYFKNTTTRSEDTYYIRNCS
jgi:cyclopropane-fatty-acyl-phospholipid synthase